MDESAVASHIRLKAAQLDMQLWRNNSGGFYDERGRFVRYGLGQTSKNDTFKSADYIGIRPVLITPEMVGQVLGVFMAVETKKSDWHFNKNDKHLLQQKNFIDIVNRYGGLAGFARSVDDFYRIIRYGND